MTPSLDAANNQRRAARRVLGELVAGRLSLERALAHPALHGLTVARVIQTLPGWGPYRTAELLADAEPWAISPNRRCGDLTLRQCRMLGRLVDR
jgi:hypothetical protein